MRIKNRPLHNSTAKRPLAVRLAFLFCGLLLVASLVIPYIKDKKTADQALQDQLPPAAEEPACPPEPSVAVQKGTIKPGDTLAAILSPHIPAGDIHALAQQCAKIYPLSRIVASYNFV